MNNGLFRSSNVINTGIGSAMSILTCVSLPKTICRRICVSRQASLSSSSSRRDLLLCNCSNRPVRLQSRASLWVSVFLAVTLELTFEFSQSSAQTVTATLNRSFGLVLPDGWKIQEANDIVHIVARDGSKYTIAQDQM